MPMNWNAENEAKLFALILRHADVKVGTDVIKAVAAEMGPDCTPKAITHRIAKIKAAANLPTSTTGASTAAATDPAASTAATDTPGTPKKTPKTPKKAATKPAPGTPRGRKRNKEATPANASEEAEDDSEPAVGCESPTKKVKREEGADGDEDAI